MNVQMWDSDVLVLCRLLLYKFILHENKLASGMRAFKAAKLTMKKSILRIIVKVLTE